MGFSVVARATVPFSKPSRPWRVSLAQPHHDLGCPHSPPPPPPPPLLLLLQTTTAAATTTEAVTTVSGRPTRHRAVEMVACSHRSHLPQTDRMVLSFPSTPNRSVGVAQHVAAATAAADPYDLPPDPYLTLQCNHCLLLSHACAVGVKPLISPCFMLYLSFTCIS